MRYFLLCFVILITIHFIERSLGSPGNNAETNVHVIVRMLSCPQRLINLCEFASTHIGRVGFKLTPQADFCPDVQNMMSKPYSHSMGEHIYIKKNHTFLIIYYVIRCLAFLSRQPKRTLKKKQTDWNLKETDLCSYFKSKLSWVNEWFFEERLHLGKWLEEVFCIEGILENITIFGANVWGYVKQSLFLSSLVP